MPGLNNNNNSFRSMLVTLSDFSNHKVVRIALTLRLYNVMMVATIANLHTSAKTYAVVADSYHFRHLEILVFLIDMLTWYLVLNHRKCVY